LGVTGTDTTPIYDSGIYLSTTSGTLVAKQLSGFATKAGALYASKSGAALASGSATQPVYFVDGKPAAADAYSTILTQASSAKDINLTIVAGGTTKTVPDLYATYVQSLKNNTTKAFLMGANATADADGNYWNTPLFDDNIYISTEAGTLVATKFSGFATRAGKLCASTSDTTGLDVGGTAQPVYFVDGVPVAANTYASILTGVTSTKDKNLAVTAGGTEKSVASVFASYIKTAPNNTTKAYVLGSTESNTTPVYDSGVYLSTTAGVLVATTFQGNATSADKLNTDAGGATQPVYFSGGKPVAANAYTTLLTAASSTADKNLSITVGGTTKEVAKLSASYIKATNNNTTKAYLLGVTTTNTTPLYDGEVYLSTASGCLHASKLEAASSVTTPAIELNVNGAASNGGYLDFHFHDANGKPTNASGTVVTTLPDYTSRIIESTAGTISVNGVNFKSNAITSGAWNGSTVAVAYGGTGITSNPSMLVNLASTAADTVFETAPRPGVTGTLPIGNGGTGNTSYSANRMVYSESAAKLSSSGHYASSTKFAVNSTAAPSYTFFVNGATGFSGGHVYLTGAQEGSSTSNTTQLVFGTSDNVHLAVSSNKKALVLNPGLTATASQIVLYLEQQSVFPGGVNSQGAFTAGSSSNLIGAVGIGNTVTFSNTDAAK
jgi:hypothetical protein